MDRDFENIFDLDDLSDDELRRLVREQLASYETIDADSILVSAEDGIVTLSGRIGTEEERRVADHVLSDVIGLTEFNNDLVVDAIRRDEAPEAVDDALAQQADSEAEPLGRPLENQDSEAEHLVEDLDARLYGTEDVQSAIERGTPWSPPETPTPEGMSGADAEPGAMGEDH